MGRAIEVTHLRKKFMDSAGGEVTVFEDLNLTIQGQTTTCIVGPSGCGKTTLLNIIAGLETQDFGNVDLDKQLWRDGKLSVGYMFQRDRLLPWRTALQNALLGSEIVGSRGNGCFEDARSLLGRFGLGGFENSYPSELSEGMRQRVALARTFLVRPKLLMLDEPFAGIDYEVKLALENELLQRVRADQMTTVIVSHDLEEAIVLGTRVIALSSRPARVQRIYEVPIPVESRNAIGVRQAEAFRTLFRQLAADVLEL